MRSGGRHQNIWQRAIHFEKMQQMPYSQTNPIGPADVFSPNIRKFMSSYNRKSLEGTVFCIFYTFLLLRDILRKKEAFPSLITYMQLEL